MSTITKESLPRPGDDSKMLSDKYRWYLANWISDDMAEKNRGSSPMSYEEWLHHAGVEPPPETIRLDKVRYGETFAINGWKFTVLDHIAGGVLCLDHPGEHGPYWAHEKFDDFIVNNLSDADITDSLDDFASHTREELGDREEDLLPMFVNLKDTAGVRNYGLYECDAGLLTLEQYGKYKRLIPKIDEPWWLATPYKAIEEHGPVGEWGASVWYVDCVGNIRYCNCSEELVVRPTVTFSPDAIVTLVKEPEAEQTDGEEAVNPELWASYMKYLDLWRAEHAGIEHYGKDPWCFEEWKDTVEAGDRYVECEDGKGADLWLDGYLVYIDAWAKAQAESGTHGASPDSYEEWLKNRLKGALDSPADTGKTEE